MERCTFKNDTTHVLSELQTFTPTYPKWTITLFCTQTYMSDLIWLLSHIHFGDVFDQDVSFTCHMSNKCLCNIVKVWNTN